MKTLRIFAACALACIAVSPAYADAISIGQAFSSGLQPYVDAAASALIAALIGWVLMVVKAKFNVDIDAQHRAALTAFLQRQASSLVADGAVKLRGVKIEVSNPAVASAANTALNAIPDALKHFGLTPAALQDRIVDMLPKEPAVAAAQATALDVANPATPSQPPKA
jgi:hypothetical protein